jgi:hypothetical protein
VEAVAPQDRSDGEKDAEDNSLLCHSGGEVEIATGVRSFDLGLGSYSHWGVL